jgi:nicotinate-nucleotide--dimethylbenzimidazole phosphoribosyltransferase
MGSMLLDLDAAQTVGLGAGGDSETLERKLEVVQSAVARARRSGISADSDPFAVLGSLGGPEFAVLTGVVLGAVDRKAAVVLDGFATTIAALSAVRLEPGVAAHLIAGQRSREQGHSRALEALGLEPLLDLRLRAGEGVGAIFATQLLRTALRMREIAGRVTPR